MRMYTPHEAADDQPEKSKIDKFENYIQKLLHVL